MKPSHWGLNQLYTPDRLLNLWSTGGEPWVLLERECLTQTHHVDYQASTHHSRKVYLLEVAFTLVLLGLVLSIWVPCSTPQSTQQSTQQSTSQSTLPMNMSQMQHSYLNRANNHEMEISAF